MSPYKKFRFFATTASACQFHYQAFCAAYDEYLSSNHITLAHKHTHIATLHHDHTHTHTKADSIILDLSSARHSISSPPVLLFREKERITDIGKKKMLAFFSLTRPSHEAGVVNTKIRQTYSHMVLLQEQEFLI